MMKFGLIFIYGFSIIKRKQHTRKRTETKMACISNNFFVLTLYILQKIFSPDKENYMFNNYVQKNESYYIQSAISFLP